MGVRERVLGVCAAVVFVAGVLAAASHDDGGGDAALDVLDDSTATTTAATGDDPDQARTAGTMPAPTTATSEPAPTTEATTTTAPAPTLPGTWTPMAASPLSGRGGAVAVWTGAELLIWSGLPALSDVCHMPEDDGAEHLCGPPAVFDGAAYDPAADTWRMIAQGPIPAGGEPTTTIPQGTWTGSHLVVWGGWGEPVSAAYDPVADEWRDLPAGPLSPRSHPEVVTWGTRVAVLGGSDQDDFESLHDGALLDPETGTWTRLPDLPSEGGQHPVGIDAAAVVGNVLVAVSGIERTAYILEPDAAAWRAMGSAGTSALDALGVTGSAWTLASSQGRTLVFDVATGWHDGGPVPEPQVGYMAAPAGDRILAVPARFAHAAEPVRTWAFDPAARAWAELAPPPFGHRVLAQTVWTGAQFVVWGGVWTGGLGGPGLADGAVLTP